MDKDFISLLYIYDSMTSEGLSEFSKANGFILIECDDFAKAQGQVKLRKPDLILIEQGLNKPLTFENGIEKLFKNAFF
ncbi:MAG: hypothetical protein GXP56_11135 [Deltaproteobacteria bacterium]|nr:hypothetical protein [Deltaproteobacteria bacterium]